MDVAILAGGFGTRLRGVWDEPKCLVPVAGKPLLFRLLHHVRRLPGVKQIKLLLGSHDYEAVILGLQRAEPVGWVGPPLRAVASKPEGTAAALRLALPGLGWPLLALNGDTLPLFPLAALAIQYGILQRTVVAVCEGRQAGACILGPEALADIASTNHSDLDVYLNEAAHFRVPGFLDIGTPENFHKAQIMKGEDFDSYENAATG